ncbi:NAD(P)H-quinone oxidoreductase [Roseibaca sp. V10]|uniref:NAD(P)H-quinone oxidoreductase n=1 Tax=Roseinatronobacter domitianus TaxID=2940293 RepID=A0ABT0M2A6_9RHOB|nr:NAD(P)H-quinone oxidoreductase [Roseibaca domitiana]MCL1628976.1 NAD(P)H-quinone oxidoreductase [Roseibaca domitiana]
MSLPETMQVIEITRPGGPEVLKPATRPVPTPAADEVLIKLSHAGVNRPDALQRAGAYDPPKGASDLPGLEGSGTVVAVGAHVTRWKPGDRVCALFPGGSYAEYATTHHGQVLPVPGTMSLRDAAGLPETFFTVWSNVFMRGALKTGETFLIHGGSSGIGTTAIQLARLFGASVFATAGSAEKCAACEKLGATRAINYREEDFVKVVSEAGGADVILDMVGGDYIKRNLRALAEDGRLVQIAFLTGPKAEINFAPLMMRRLTITGSTLRPQSDQAKHDIAQQLEQCVWPALAEGQIAPVMDRVFALQDASDAHELMESSAHIGKILLEITAQ